MHSGLQRIATAATKCTKGIFDSAGQTVLMDATVANFFWTHLSRRGSPHRLPLKEKVDHIGPMHISELGTSRVCKLRCIFDAQASLLKSEEEPNLARAKPAHGWIHI